MLFLGAGASKEIGPPTMKKLSQILEKELQKEGHDNLISDIKNRLRNFGFKECELDFEVIFSIINGLENPRKTINGMNPFATYMYTFCKEKILPKTINSFRDITEKVVRDECLKYNANKAIKIYQPLLKTLGFTSARKVIL